MDPVDRQAATLAALDERYAHSAIADLDGLRGRRSILVRHAPVLCRLCHVDDEHWVDAVLAHDTWPSPDWTDAAAGLEVPDAESL